MPKPPEVARARLPLAAVAALAAVAVATIAAAQTETPMAALRAACGPDVKALCAGVQPGGGRLKQCLRGNKDKLSTGCKQAIATAMQARAAKSQAQPKPQR